LLFVAAVISTAVVTKNAVAGTSAQGQGQDAWFTFTVMKGYFMQDEDGTDPAKTGFVSFPKLGELMKREWTARDEVLVVEIIDG
jgi:hypothetical protein